MTRNLSTTGLATAGVKGHSRRLVATALAIVIGVGFVVSSLLILDGATAGLRDHFAEGADKHDVVVTPGSADVDLSVADTLRARDDVATVSSSAISWALDADGRSAPLVLPSPNDRVELVEGRMPPGPGQAVVTTLYANTAGVGIGDTVEVYAEDEDGSTGEPAELDVIGVAELSGSQMYVGSDALLISEETARDLLPGYAFRDLRVDLVPGADLTASLTSMTEDLAAGSGDDAVTIRTGADEAQARVMAMMNDVDYLRMILLSFGAIGLLTTILVIANTFRIVLTQRSQELALLRCIGATRGQVRRAVLAEASLLGAAASAVGVAAGVGLTAAALALLPPIDMFGAGHLQFSPTLGSLVGPWLVGVLITVAAAWFPTRTAAQTQPIHALHSHTDSDRVGARRTGRTRLVVAGLLILTGAAALVVGALGRSVPLGLLGGAVSFVGILVAGAVIVPAMVRMLGAPARAAGVPGDIAVRSTVSNPGRVAATSAALVIGVALITMTSVGAATAERTVLAEVDETFALDVMVAGMGAPPSGDDGASATAISRQTVEGIREVDGVDQTASLRRAWLEVGPGGGPSGPPIIDEVELFSFQPDELAQVLHRPDLAADLREGTLGAGADWLRAYGLQPGERYQVTGPSGTADIEVVVIEGLGAWMGYIAPDVMDAVDADAGAGGLAVSLEDGLEGSALGNTISDIRAAGSGDSVFVSGGAVDRAEITGAVSAIVLVITGLLGVAVVIALVGIANTLSLSVVERSRENALLRALGLSRGQLRGMLAGEGVLLALAGTVIGMVAGVIYAWFGVQALMPQGSTAQLDLPWITLGVIALVAIVAGILASVLPARRAARTAPAAGLAAW